MRAEPLLLPVLLSTGLLREIDGAALVRVARDAVVAEVRHTKLPPPPDIGPAKPVFVTIERKNQVLGCRGSLIARRGTLGQEITDAARSAAAHDARYRPLTTKDLDGFLVTVTLVDRVETISNVTGLRPDDGLVLTMNGKTGIVLPWEGKDPNVRLRWAYQKAGVPVGTAVTLQRLVAERWRG